MESTKLREQEPNVKLALNRDSTGSQVNTEQTKEVYHVMLVGNDTYVQNTNFSLKFTRPREIVINRVT